MNTLIKYCLDANVLITAWHTQYPPDLFPGLWQLLIDNDHKRQLTFPETIFNEIEPYSSASDKNLSEGQRKEKYPLRYWLEKNGFNATDESNEVHANALQLEAKYQTKEPGKGASKNDILLIAFAKQQGHTLVTLEGQQSQKPQKKRNYKIPLICSEEGVNCINFVEFLREITKTSP